MSKRKRRIPYILLTVIMLACLWNGKSVNATGTIDETDLKDKLNAFSNSMRSESVLDVERQNNLDDLAVFPLFVMNDDEVDCYMHCFYIEHDGGEYLVTSPAAAIADLGGYDLIAYVNQKLCTVEVIGVDDFYSYLSCDNLDQMEPITRAEALTNDDMYVVYSVADGDSNIKLKAEIVEIGGWREKKGYFSSDTEVSDDTMSFLGMPGFDEETGELVAMFSIITDTEELICLDVTETDFSTRYAVGEVKQQPVDREDDKQPEKEEQPEKEPSEKKTESEGEPSESKKEPEGEPSKEEEESGVMSGLMGEMEWVFPIAVIVIVIALIAVKNNKNKKKPKAGGTSYQPQEESRESGVSAYEELNQEGTISLDMGETVMQENHTEIENIPQPKWQIRGMSGVFQGQTYALETVLRFGRNPVYEVAFPENTKGISGSHCELAVENGRIILRDLGSTYGTYLNYGEKLNGRISYEVKEGDIFYLADKEQSFRVEKIGESRQEFTPVVKAIVNPAEGKTYHADAAGRISFGRAASNQVAFALDDMKISTNHCVLYREGSELYLMDLGSTNGTYMSNDQRLRPNTPYRVQRGSSFYLTSQNYLFVITED